MSLPLKAVVMLILLGLLRRNSTMGAGGSTIECLCAAWESTLDCPPPPVLVQGWVTRPPEPTPVLPKCPQPPHLYIPVTLNGNLLNRGLLETYSGLGSSLQSLEFPSPIQVEVKPREERSAPCSPSSTDSSGRFCLSSTPQLLTLYSVSRRQDPRMMGKEQ